LFDAGVKMKSHVSGIAMGLITRDDGKVAVLSDILGDEDHLGDMDFKVTGTANGICGCQMDIKVFGLSYETMYQALEQARDGRLHILSKLAETIAQPREDYKPHAPRVEKIIISKEFIGAVIGPGGKVIQEMQKETGTTINITEVNDTGEVLIYGPNKESIDAAVRRVKGIVTVPEAGEVYEAKVKSIMPYGAFVEFLPGKEGLLHISEVSYKRLESMEGVMNVGDVIKVKLLEVDKKTGKFKLSRKALLEKQSQN
jgi:polyribonucleotide nucleotidyltransferase